MNNFNAIRKNAPLFIFLFCSFSSILNAQANISKENQDKLISEINHILQAQVDEDKIPGAVIQVRNGNQVFYSKAFGYAQKYDFNHQALRQPEVMTPQHLFDIASLTKVIGTTTAIMLLVDKELIRINDPVYKYIRAFNTPEKNKITIRHLLTHTAGLYEWYPLYYRATNETESYNIIESLPLKYRVGKERHYSDLGFVLLGRIVEIVSGLPLDLYTKQNIFDSLGMSNTLYNPLTSEITRKIVTSSPGNPYEKRMVYDSTLGFKFKEIDPTSWNGWRMYNLKGEVNDGNAWYANGGISGAAGLFSTVADLQKLINMLMAKGKIKTSQFISEKTIEAFLQKDQFKNGLGWMMDPGNSVMKNAPKGTYGHTGFTGTSIVVIPSYQTSIILLINRQNAGLLNGREYYNLGPLREQIFKTVLNYCK